MRHRIPDRFLLAQAIRYEDVIAGRYVEGMGLYELPGGSLRITSGRGHDPWNLYQKLDRTELPIDGSIGCREASGEPATERSLFWSEFGSVDQLAYENEPPFIQMRGRFTVTVIVERLPLYERVNGELVQYAEKLFR